MPFRGRVLIGMTGHEVDARLIRYASMIVRLPSPPQHAGRTAPTFALAAPALSDAAAAWGEAAEARSPLPPAASGDDPEVRFVYLLPAMPATRGQAPRRAALRSQIHTYFTGAAEQVAVGCDVLKGQALRRLPALAMDFDSELLLLGDAAWPRWQCGRLAMEAPCSVWLVPPESAPVLRRVLVPIDFSERSAHCLRAALELARPFPRSKCLALHVYRHDTRFADLAFDQLCRHTLADRFARFVAGIDTHGVALEPIFAESHRVDQEIARAAQRQGADLIVMTSRGRTRAARIALPSVTEGTLCQSRAACLVLKSADSPIGLWQALRERWHRADGIHFS